jgi:phosphoenolpyruvate---glycerone phosphotransferase subunit DhaL
LTDITRSDITRWLMAFADLIAANKDYLTELDSAIGDADHGINMERGFQAVLLKLPTLADQDIGSICKAVGMTLVSTVGGASGPLYGTFFLQLGAASAGKLEMTLSDWAAALEAGVDGVQRRGKAAPGDKTMLDSLLPGLAALKKAAVQNAEWAEALAGCEQAARQGMLDTIPLVARKGRASYLGERSAGHQDPGATSAHLLLLAAMESWTNAK